MAIKHLDDQYSNGSEQSKGGDANVTERGGGGVKRTERCEWGGDDDELERTDTGD
jgi:hypothetical protein